MALGAALAATGGEWQTPIQQGHTCAKRLNADDFISGPSLFWSVGANHYKHQRPLFFLKLILDSNGRPRFFQREIDYLKGLGAQFKPEKIINKEGKELQVWRAQF